MSNFRARTRVRGEVDYHLATWVDNGNYRVKFEEGPHEGKCYNEEQCAIAKDDEWKTYKEIKEKI